jgi:hypothetical protein
MTGFIADSIVLPGRTRPAETSPLLERYIDVWRRKYEIYKAAEDLDDQEWDDATNPIFFEKSDLEEEILASDDLLAKEAVLCYYHLNGYEPNDHQMRLIYKRLDWLIGSRLGAATVSDDWRGIVKNSAIFETDTTST